MAAQPHQKYFLMAPMSRLGLIFGCDLAKLLPHAIAAVDDFHPEDTLYGIPRWSSTRFLKEAKTHENACALDLSTGTRGKTWVTGLLKTAGVPRLCLQDALPALNSAHSNVTPRETFSPWLADARFLETVADIQDATLVDHYRLWELWCLVAETAALPGDILEVGVWRGGTAALMARRMQYLRQTDSLHLCDTFRGVVKAGEHDNYYAGGEHADATQAQVEILLRSQAPELQKVQIWTGIFPDETGPSLKNRKFRLVHIDVDTYLSAKEVLDFVWPRMPSGAVVVYDDYGCDACAGIVRHVEEQRGMSDRLVVHNLNGHALLIKR